MNVQAGGKIKETTGVAGEESVRMGNGGGGGEESGHAREVPGPGVLEGAGLMPTRQPSPSPRFPAWSGPPASDGDNGKASGDFTSGLL